MSPAALSEPGSSVPPKSWLAQVRGAMVLSVRRLEERIEEGMAVATVPGVALGVVSGGELMYARGFGRTAVEDGGIPVTPVTLFRIGSTTKPMTGTVIMALVEEGLLELDEPVRSYLPWFRLSDPEATRSVSLRHVLSHTAGLPQAADHHGSRAADGLETYVRHEVPLLPLVAAPGKLFSYSNPGFSIAGLVAEVVAGRPYPKLVEDIVFGPLGMTRSTFDPTVAMTYPLAQSHELDARGQLRVDHHFADTVWGYPAGFAFCTIEASGR